jgi:hypothetical protein
MFFMIVDLRQGQRHRILDAVRAPKKGVGDTRLSGKPQSSEWKKTRAEAMCSNRVGISCSYE